MVQFFKGLLDTFHSDPALHSPNKVIHVSVRVYWDTTGWEGVENAAQGVFASLEKLKFSPETVYVCQLGITHVTYGDAPELPEDGAAHYKKVVGENVEFDVFHNVRF